MRKAMLFFGLMLAGGGCVSSGSQDNYRLELNGLEEMSFGYIADKWGKPDYDLPTRSGRVVKYVDILGYDTDPVEGLKKERLCTIRLELDREGIVSDWSYESCRDKKTGESVEPNLRLPEIPEAPQIDTSSPIFDQAESEKFSS